MVEFTYNQNPVPFKRPRFNRGQSFNDKAYSTYKANLAAALVAERLPRIPEGIELKLVAKFYRDSRRRVDLDNLEKALNDALQDAGILPDDSQIVESHTFKGYDKENPRTVFCLVQAAGYRAEKD